MNSLSRKRFVVGLERTAPWTPRDRAACETMLETLTELLSSGVEVECEGLRYDDSGCRFELRSSDAKFGEGSFLWILEAIRFAEIAFIERVA